MTALFAVLFTFAPTRDAEAHGPDLGGFFSDIFSEIASGIGSALAAPFEALGSVVAHPYFDIEVSTGWLGQMNEGKLRQGFQFMLSDGYRIMDWLNISVDQGLGGLYWKNADAEQIKAFVGHTMASVKFSYTWWDTKNYIAPFFDVWTQLGLGGMYISEIHSEGNKLSGAFACKSGIGFTGYIGMWGIGLRVDYTFALFDKEQHYLDAMIVFRVSDF